MYLSSLVYIIFSLRGRQKQSSFWRVPFWKAVLISEWHGTDSPANCFSVSAVFAWEAYEHGADVHAQADPTKLALLANEVKDRKEATKVEQKNSILEKYGGEEHLEAPPKQLLLAQTVPQTLELVTDTVTQWHLTYRQLWN